MNYQSNPRGHSHVFIFQLLEPLLMTEERSGSYKESAVYYFITGHFTVEPIEA